MTKVTYPRPIKILMYAILVSVVCMTAYSWYMLTDVTFIDPTNRELSSSPVLSVEVTMQLLLITGQTILVCAPGTFVRFDKKSAKLWDDNERADGVPGRTRILVILILTAIGCAYIDLQLLLDITNIVRRATEVIGT